MGGRAAFSKIIQLAFWLDCAPVHNIDQSFISRIPRFPSESPLLFVSFCFWPHRGQHGGSLLRQRPSTNQSHHHLATSGPSPLDCWYSCRNLVSNHDVFKCTQKWQKWQKWHIMTPLHAQRTSALWAVYGHVYDQLDHAELLQSWWHRLKQLWLLTAAALPWVHLLLISNLCSVVLLIFLFKKWMNFWCSRKLSEEYLLHYLSTTNTAW